MACPSPASKKPSRPAGSVSAATVRSRRNAKSSPGPGSQAKRAAAESELAEEASASSKKTKVSLRPGEAIDCEVCGKNSEDLFWGISFFVWGAASGTQRGEA